MDAMQWIVLLGWIALGANGLLLITLIIGAWTAPIETFAAMHAARTVAKELSK